MILDLEDDYKLYLGIDNSDLDDVLEAFAETAEALVVDYLNRDLVSTAYTEYYDGNGKSEIILNQFPVTALTSVSVWDSIDEEWDLLVEGTDYERSVIRPGAFSIYLDGYTFWKGIHNYKVIYVAGYSTIPYPIQLACKKILKIIYDESPIKNDTVGKVSFNKGANGQGENFAIDQEAVEKELKKIKNYRVENV